MVDKELDAGADDCKFPNVRKSYWRSATWSPHYTPLAENAEAVTVGDLAVLTNSRVPPRTPRSHEHNASSRSRVPLLPLSIAKKSLEEWPCAALDDSPDLTSPITPGRRRVKAGLDIKLDLASIHRTLIEPTEIQLKRDKFALFDKQCSRVASYHIYLGSDAVAKDREILHASGITHVLNCVGFVCPEYFKGDLVYKTLWLQDSPCEDITSLLYDVFDYFEEVREQGGQVFVHCCQGVSRSTTLVIAYVMWRERSSFDDAFQKVKAARGVTNPNMGFACQLLQCQKRVHAMPMSPKSVLRMYRLAPHSPYDPLHLVPKALINPGVGCLDSRGAFVIQTRGAILVWIGHCCDPKMAQAAEEAADQVVRYERLEHPVQVFVEGDKDMEFWESLSNYPHSEKRIEEAHSQESSLRSDKNNKDEVDRFRQLGVSNRKIPSNDADYELYQTARLGGVIPPVPFTGRGITASPTRIPIREDGWSVLRRKFLCRQLAHVKPRLASEVPNLSPDTSMASSSPHFSPFSVSSMSSSAPAGSDSPFASPVLSLGHSSPGTELTEGTKSGPTSLCSSSFHHTHSFISVFPIPSSLRTSAANKSPALSLAQRRGSLPPTLHLPNLDVVLPPTSRKPKLLPLVMKEIYNTEHIIRDNEDANYSSDAAQSSPSNLSMQLRTARDVQGLNDLQVRSSSAVHVSCSFHRRSSLPEAECVFLYLWPGLERIDVFNSDDLDTRSVFILRKNSQGVKVFVWVGKQLAANKEHQFNGSSSDVDAIWHKVGVDFIERMQLIADVPISVVREGQEPEEFWKAFNQQ